jgi:hypothetical protein
MNLGMFRNSRTGDRDALGPETEKMADRCIAETRTLPTYCILPHSTKWFRCAAEWYVGGFAERSGIKVTLDLPTNLERLPDAVEVASFRVLQEALANIHRHAESPAAERPRLSCNSRAIRRTSTSCARSKRDGRFWNSKVRSCSATSVCFSSLMSNPTRCRNHGLPSGFRTILTSR